MSIKPDRMFVLILAILAAVVGFTGCGGNSDTASDQNLPYRPVEFDALGVARFDAQPDDVLVVYRTGDPAPWPTMDTQPPYAPITVAQVGAQSRSGSALPSVDDNAKTGDLLSQISKGISGQRSSRFYQPEVGDTHLFKVGEPVTEVNMELRGIGNHCYIWIPYDISLEVPDEQIQYAISEFDRVYEIDVALFGPPSNIDYDPRMYVLGMSIPSAGLFSSDINSLNGLDIIIIDLASASADNNAQMGELMAHELHHSIWWQGKGNNGYKTLNEGMSEFGAFKAAPDRFEATLYTNFIRFPNGFSYVLTNSQFMYGGGFALSAYLNDRFGAEATKQIGGTSPYINSDNLEKATGCSAEQLMIDWSVALLLTDKTTDKRYRITSVPTRGVMPNGTTLPALGMTPMDGSVQTRCRAWGFCYYRATTAGSYTATVEIGKDFKALLVPGGAQGL